MLSQIKMLDNKRGNFYFTNIPKKAITLICPLCNSIQKVREDIAENTIEKLQLSSYCLIVYLMEKN